MSTLIEVPNQPDTITNPPESLPGLLEWSVLGLIAVFLIKGLWKEFCESEKAERELINKLIDNHLKNKD
ncbi:hypothetical protein Glo7428_3157 [Gloeocapsa sp. PCC 7428]|uniref:hypothetical protein n=1 Tax=Gloeocapsa sp. PCC 7428 TaxID=1173026 RepID=UPI0002A5F9D4|nr:hypothetical protein [Gloeocapsa sp. PCC 7428]AFZ31644.1 hypothetical protein Glo7428_3157 [Gloeocapsa sp. PCC 7428]